MMQCIIYCRAAGSNGIGELYPSRCYDRWMKVRKYGGVLAICGLAIGIGLYFLVSRPSVPERLRRECRDVMGRGDCLIMHNAAYLPPEVKEIFISGYGTLRADIYRELRGIGIDMCDRILDACQKDFESEVCRLGRALYSKN